MLVADAEYFKGDFKKAIESYEKYFANHAKAETALLFRAGYANYATGILQKESNILTKQPQPKIRSAITRPTISVFCTSNKAISKMH